MEIDNSDLRLPGKDCATETRREFIFQQGPDPRTDYYVRIGRRRSRNRLPRIGPRDEFVDQRLEQVCVFGEEPFHDGWFFLELDAIEKAAISRCATVYMIYYLGTEKEHDAPGLSTLEMYACLVGQPTEFVQQADLQIKLKTRPMAQVLLVTLQNPSRYLFCCLNSADIGAILARSYFTTCSVLLVQRFETTLEF